MIKIRYGAFETNSSSVHCMLLVDDETLQKLKNNELLIRGWEARTGKEFLTLEEAKQYLVEELPPHRIDDLDKDELIEWLHEYNIAHTLDRWCEELDYDKNEWTSPHGDHINILCAYGRDG